MNRSKALERTSRRGHPGLGKSPFAGSHGGESVIVEKLGILLGLRKELPQTTRIYHCLPAAEDCDGLQQCVTCLLCFN
jgi:hypothetical protein